MKKTKSFIISKHQVWHAYERVKANKGAAGIDDESIADFESKLKDNLYKIWNRMSSGTYFPPPVRVVEIPKKNGGKRKLGVPTVSDRIAQMVVKINMEPEWEPHFHEDSYGYRPGKSAIQAVGVTRKRCWRYNWLLEFDIKGAFDNIDHELLMKAVKTYTTERWVLLYLQRWLEAPFQQKDGSIIRRERGTPQGGVISPLLCNIFLHFVYDKWMDRNFPNNPICRYADDGIVHCNSEREATLLKQALTERFKACKLELHPEKTKIVYCKDDDRKENYVNEKFDFLSYTFRPRRAKNKFGKHFISFLPAVSDKSSLALRRKTKSWKIHLRSDKTIEDISRMFNPVLAGWINYFKHYYKSEMYKSLRHFDSELVLWAKRKYKKLKRHHRRARYWLGRIAEKEPYLFAHWKMGLRPSTG